MTSLLKQTQQAFDDWRTQGHRQNFFNTKLKNMAINLLSTHAPPVVSEVTGVTVKTLRNWRRELTVHQSNIGDNDALSFIKLRTERGNQIESVQQSNSYCSLSIHLPNNLQLNINNFPLEHTVKLVHALSKEFSA